MEGSVVFTVKLEPSLIGGIKSAASSMGLSISKIVKMALEEFLSKRNRGSKKETSEVTCRFDRLGEQKLTQVYRLLVRDAPSHDVMNRVVSPEEHIDYENSSD